MLFKFSWKRLYKFYCENFQYFSQRLFSFILNNKSLQIFLSWFSMNSLLLCIISTVFFLHERISLRLKNVIIKMLEIGKRRFWKFSSKEAHAEIYDFFRFQTSHSRHLESQLSRINKLLGFFFSPNFLNLSLKAFKNGVAKSSFHINLLPYGFSECLQWTFNDKRLMLRMDHLCDNRNVQKSFSLFSFECRWKFPILTRIFHFFTVSYLSQLMLCS